MENIPESGSFVMASNHVSYLDPLAIGAFVSRDLNFITKKELFKNRIFGWYFKKLRMIPVDRKGFAYAGMKKVIQMIKKGCPIAVFPEGTRSNGRVFLKPELGVGYFALKFNLPVLPVYVKGTEKALPLDASFITPHPVRVYYGKPKKYHVPPESSGERAYEEISYKVMDEIKELKDKYGAQG
ncbi:MAG: lysophospholipid acyltransferase family protein [Candidatus Omnitrophota bacterium]|nr:lysophospholipid acyltransferase family protein [Candidatus Omnitrophota bacterium]